MCMAVEKKCQCGARSAAFHFRDNIMSEQVVENLYCPSCSSDVAFDTRTMVSDNGWIISYGMEAAKASAQEGLRRRLTPDVLFDEGYCSWNGMYPGDQRDSMSEREQIVALAKKDPRGYLNRLRAWSIDRIERLRHEGWRKAKNAA